eukprot:CAMPEP_0203688926 /NCGR_PEP_ID=MMETSP0091-20130426/1426_1 /ASSEMBLY_ACC=CAM_ASM_001089 /TAXON_ID=426623 /ORGANISM="Chaetoceros affinis, Strain CCMP159" /LENGTH=147 /DNA_ID=CAMNT_0050558485 /DNA_START=57 /DNA_END=500 /DNA_ORIENTATION=+
MSFDDCNSRGSDDGHHNIIFDQGYEVMRVPTPRGRRGIHTPSPSRRGRRSFTTSPSPTGRRKNRLITPIRTFSFRRRNKKDLPPAGPDSEAALVVRRTQWEEERERIREEERKKKLIDFEIGTNCLSLSCQCWGGSLLVPDHDDDEY